MTFTGSMKRNEYMLCMPRVTVTQQKELCESHVKELEARIATMEQERREQDAILAEIRVEAGKIATRIEEMTRSILTLQVENHALEEKLEEEKDAHGDTKRAWDAQVEEERGLTADLHAAIQKEREHSSNVLAYLVASLVGTFGAAVAAVWSVRCQQEPEL